MLDLMKIATTESEGGDLKSYLSNLYQETSIRPNGYPNAIVWKGGKHDQIINPICQIINTICQIIIIGWVVFALLSIDTSRWSNTRTGPRGGTYQLNRWTGRRDYNRGDPECIIL